MSREEEIGFHRQRASAELDRAVAATTIAAARAHFKLSSLHRERAAVLASGHRSFEGQAC